MNSFLTLCIMLGAAFTVQYTAHVNRRFVRSNAPTRWHKMIDALSCYSGPIFWGGVTTAVAVSAAAFLPAKYFRLYFFYSFLIMVGFGIFNGLIVQSALFVLFPTSIDTFNIPMFGEDPAPELRYEEEGVKEKEAVGGGEFEMVPVAPEATGDSEQGEAAVEGEDTDSTKKRT